MVRYCIPPSCRRLFAKNRMVTKTLCSQYYGETVQTCRNVCIWSLNWGVQRVGQWAAKSPWMQQYRIFWSRQATFILSQYHNKRFYKLRAGQPRNRCSIHGKGKIFVYTRSARTGSVKEILPGGGKLSGRAKASLWSSGKIKNEWIYNSAPPWAFMTCIETSLLLHILMALCKKRAAPPSSCTKRRKCSGSHSVFSTHIGARYLESATYEEITYNGQSEAVKGPIHSKLNCAV